MTNGEGPRVHQLPPYAFQRSVPFRERVLLPLDKRISERLLLPLFNLYSGDRYTYRRLLARWPYISLLRLPGEFTLDAAVRTGRPT